MLENILEMLEPLLGFIAILLVFKIIRWLI